MARASTCKLIAFFSFTVMCLHATLANAADCDRGQRVAIDLFQAADGHAIQRSCLNRKVRIKKTRVDGRTYRSAEVRTSRHVGCMVSNEIRDFGSAMQGTWNRLVDQNWATIGPRTIVFDSVQSGTTVNPTRRTFVSHVPLDSDYATINLTKRGGGSTTQIAVCSHGPDGDTRLEHSAVIAGDRPDGYVWSPPEMEDMLNRIVSIQIQPTSAAKRIGYVLQVNKGEAAELVEEETPSSSEQEAAPASGATLPGGPTQGVQLPTGPVSLPGTASSNPGSTTSQPTGSQMTPALPGVTGANLPQEADSTATGLEDVSATSGQCLVTTTRRFPEIRLRCGLSSEDEKVDVNDDFLADCPLVAGDTVNVEVVEGQKEIRITGRATGGEWCATRYSPGYYVGPCSSRKTDESTTQVRTYFYQGRKLVDSVIPATCKPARLEAGKYRVITEIRTSGKSGSPGIETREGGLNLAGEEMIGDVSGLLNQPITPR